MDIQEFIQNFADQFEDTPIEEFKAETAFRDLDEWSSLLALSIMAMVDEEYDVQLKAEEMRQAQTIEDLFKVVESKA